MNDEILNEIKKLNKLLVLILMKDFKKNEKILFLNSSGFPPKEIAEILGTTSNSISVTLNRLKKRGK